MNCYSHVTLPSSYEKIKEEIHLKYNYMYPIQATSVNHPSLDAYLIYGEED
jgi:hypothetical protein